MSDNSNEALKIREGNNNYFKINTIDGSESISFGNATTNPDFNFLGGETTIFDGDVNVQGVLWGGSPLKFAHEGISFLDSLDAKDFRFIKPRDSITLSRMFLKIHSFFKLKIFRIQTKWRSFLRKSTKIR